MCDQGCVSRTWEEDRKKHFHVCTKRLGLGQNGETKLGKKKFQEL